MKIDQGCHRLVLILNKIVIKFPNPRYYWKWFIKGFKGNIQETQLSKMGNKHLCPILFSAPFGLFLIMKKAKSLTSSDLEIDLYNFMEINNITSAENKMESFGWLNNRLVCIDYENQ